MQVHKYVQKINADWCKWFMREPLPSRMHAKRMPLTASFSRADARQDRRPGLLGPALGARL